MGLLTVIATIAVVGVPLPAIRAQPSAPEVSTVDEDSMLRHAETSVVTVRAELPGGSTVSSGSGFFVSRDGRLLTNAHVVDGAIRVSVVTPAGQAHSVQKVAVDNSIDVAELSAGMASDPLPLSSVPAVPGLPVYLLGNPGGTSPNTVTKGRVVAVHQRMQTPEGRVYPDMIQTDANSAPGNSGGPALNPKGEVIGMVTLGDQRSLIGAALPVARFQPAVAGWSVVAPSPYPKPVPVPVLSSIAATCSVTACAVSVSVLNRGGDGYITVRFAITSNGQAVGGCDARVLISANTTGSASCSASIKSPRPDFSAVVSASVVEVAPA